MNKRPPFWAIVASVSALGAAAIVGSITYAQRSPYRISSSDIPQSIRQSNLIASNFSRRQGGGSSIGGGAPAPTDPTDDNKIAVVTEMLMTKYNYLQHPIDNTISERLFDRFLDDLDPQHLYFTRGDMDDWKTLRDSIGPSIRDTGDTSFAQTAFARFKQRLSAQVDFVQDALKTKTFSFTGNDTIDTDRKSAPRPKDLTEAQGLWWKQLEFEYLQELLTHKKPADIITTLSKRYARLKKNIAEEDADEIFELYLTTFCEAFDPHSDYFGKASTDEFAIRMNASLSGIGAQLLSEDGYVKIVDLIPGGPAMKSKKLKVGDKILGVAQGDTGEVVDVEDTMSITKVVQMIRGEKGTTVRLIIQPNGADPTVRKTVPLVRDEVKLEDRLAKAQMVQMPSSDGGKPARVGIITLPSFYGEPGSPHRTTSDIRVLINKLKEQGVTGIILDLRGNPGGSLEEAAGCAGLFIPGGPVVQSRYSSGQIDQKNDPEPGPAWTGPLVVLTNKLSASAAEIVTGALRDYGRAVVVGDDHTFGKSTVQDQLPLAEVMANAKLKTSGDPGSIHLTIAKYYLPGGNSVQLTGVPSNIVIPSATNILKVGEATLNNPLPSDSIPSAAFTKQHLVEPYVATLKERSEKRVASNPDFAYLKTEIARLKKTLDEKTISLNLADREKERKETDARIAARKKALASRPPLKETVWAITVADAVKPGLPAPLKPGKIADASTAEASDDPSSDDETGADKTTGPTERDLTLDESEHILLDYAGMLKK